MGAEIKAAKDNVIDIFEFTLASLYSVYVSFFVTAFFHIKNIFCWNINLLIFSFQLLYS